jgi:hypothetical protein
VHLITTWRSRPLDPDQFDRLLSVWGKMEERAAADPSSERVCWFQFSDGSGGLTIDRVADVDAALALGLEQALTLGEFVELDTKIGVDLDVALPLIIKAQENARG